MSRLALAWSNAKFLQPGRFWQANHCVIDHTNQCLFVLYNTHHPPTPNNLNHALIVHYLLLHTDVAASINIDKVGKNVALIARCICEREVGIVPILLMSAVNS